MDTFIQIALFLLMAGGAFVWWRKSARSGTISTEYFPIQQKTSPILFGVYRGAILALAVLCLGLAIVVAIHALGI